MMAGSRLLRRMMSVAGMGEHRRGDKGPGKRTQANRKLQHLASSMLGGAVAMAMRCVAVGRLTVAVATRRGGQRFDGRHQLHVAALTIRALEGECQGDLFTCLHLLMKVDEHDVVAAR